MAQNEIEQQFLFLQHVCKTSEAAYAKDPSDAESLTLWGATILEMASFFPIREAETMIQDAMLKLEEALEIAPNNSKTLNQLGNANLSLGLVTTDGEDAGVYFNKANGYFEKACEEEPDNQLYRKALAMSAKGPELHAELQQQNQAAAGQSTAKSAGKKKRNGDLKYDIMGWVIIAVGFVAITVYSRSQMPPPPSREG